MPQRPTREALFEALDDDVSAKVWRRVLPSYVRRDPTLLVYNTVERLLGGDLQHTVTIDDVWADLFAFPRDWLVVGIGTTDWLRRNGEMMPEGTTRELRFWWADPKTSPQAHLIDLDERPPEQDIAEGTIVKRMAQFPWLSLAVCDPEVSVTWRAENVDDLHEWLKYYLPQSGVKLAGLRVRGVCGKVVSSDAHYLPDTGIDLGPSGGHDAADYFRVSENQGGEWTLNGVYAADESLHPFMSVRGKPVHLHGYDTARMVGGHINSAQVVDAEVMIYPLKDIVMKLNDVK